jgi:carboxyl-terminal processing protease
LKYQKKTKATEVLVGSKALFNFAIDYFYKNPRIEAVENYQFSNADFKNFTNYLVLDTTFVTKQERLFETAFLSIENTSISKEYQKIKEKLSEDKIEEISKNQDIIQILLEEEILEKYYYKEGVYQHHLKNDYTIIEAVKLLQNQDKYTQILSGK